MGAEHHSPDKKRSQGRQEIKRQQPAAPGVPQQRHRPAKNAHQGIGEAHGGTSVEAAASGMAGEHVRRAWVGLVGFSAFGCS